MGRAVVTAVPQISDGSFPSSHLSHERAVAILGEFDLTAVGITEQAKTLAASVFVAHHRRRHPQAVQLAEAPFPLGDIFVTELPVVAGPAEAV